MIFWSIIREAARYAFFFIAAFIWILYFTVNLFIEGFKSKPIETTFWLALLVLVHYGSYLIVTKIARWWRREK